MPDLRMLTSFQLTLSKDELTLVQRALRGVLTDEELASALALQEALLLQKAAILGQASIEAGKAATNIERARAEETSPGLTRKSLKGPTPGGM